MQRTHTMHARNVRKTTHERQRNATQRSATCACTQDVGFFDKNKSGELVNRLSADVTMLNQVVEVNQMLN